MRADETGEAAAEMAVSWAQVAVEAATGLLVSAILVLILLRIMGRRLPGTVPPPRETALLCPLTLLIYLGLTMTVQVLIGLLSRSDRPEGDSGMELGMIITVGVNTLAVLLAFAYGRSRLRTTPRHVGLGPARPSSFLFAALLLAAAMPAFLGVGLLSFKLNQALDWEQHQALVRSLLEEPALRENPFIVFAIVVVVPLLEEILFRGLVQRSFRAVLRPAWAIVATALIFAVSHDIQSALPVFVVGVTLGIICETTGSIYPAALGHSIFNGLMVAFISLGAH